MQIVYGWDIEKVEDAITAVIHSTGYNGTVDTAFELTEAEIHVRPSTTLSRMLSNTCWKILLIITLIYPFLWLYKRFSSHGGGKWEVCGGAYALKAWRPMQNGESPPIRQNGEGRVIETREGVRLKLVGVREGEWFQQWEGMIRQAVMERRISDAPIVTPDGRVADDPVVLRPDGSRPYESEI